jgi:hypothetical protein
MGGPAIGFYEGTNALEKITLHHGTGLRWDEGWPGDALLTPTSQVAIAKWFDEHGYSGIEDARKKRIEEARREEQVDKEFWVCFPDPVRTYFLSAPWTNDIPNYRPGMGDYWAASSTVKVAIAAEVTRLIGDPVEATTSAFKALGSKKYPYSWSGRGEREAMAVSVATNASTEIFLEALSRIEGDEKAMCGASLIFFSEDHGDTIPKEHRGKWILNLSEFVLRGKGYHAKPRVLYWLMRAGTPETVGMVRDAASGEYGDIEFPGEYSRDRETGIRATACLLLAMEHDKEARSLAEKTLPAMKTKPNIAALELASILTGITNRVKKSHFEITSWTIPEAAAQGVVENPNQENIDLLVDIAIDDDYATVSYPALEALAKIAGFDWYKNGERPQPGQRDKAKEWWKKNRHRFKPATEK